MDASLYRAVNRLAGRTSWMHWLFVGIARYGIALFAVALLIGWVLARNADSPDGVVAVWWTGGAALVALGVGQVIGNAVDRARPDHDRAPASVLAGVTGRAPVAHRTRRRH